MAWRWIKNVFAFVDVAARREARRNAAFQADLELKNRHLAYLLKVRQEWAREHKVGFNRLSDREWDELVNCFPPAIILRQ